MVLGIIFNAIKLYAKALKISKNRSPWRRNQNAFWIPGLALYFHALKYIRLTNSFTINFKILIN